MLVNLGQLLVLVYIHILYSQQTSLLLLVSWLFSLPRFRVVVSSCFKNRNDLNGLHWTFFFILVKDLLHLIFFFFYKLTHLCCVIDLINPQGTFIWFLQFKFTVPMFPHKLFYYLIISLKATGFYDRNKGSRGVRLILVVTLSLYLLGMWLTSTW